LDQNVVAVELDRVALHLARGVVGIDTRPRIETPLVPGTGHYCAGELAFAQRTTLVGAGVVDRQERAVAVEKGDCLALRLDGDASPDPNVSDPCNLHELGHPIDLADSGDAKHTALTYKTVVQ